MTEYVILAEGTTDASEEDTWVDVARVSARSHEGAIRAYLDGSSPAGRYVAVPARSFKPVTPTAETKTILKFA